MFLLKSPFPGNGSGNTVQGCTSYNAADCQNINLIKIGASLNNYIEDNYKVQSWMMMAMSPAAVVTEVTNMDTSACCSVEDTWRFSNIISNSNCDDGDE